MELLNRIPNWIRWILVPIASLLSAAILNILMTLFYDVLPYLQPIDPDSFGMKALKSSFVPLMTGLVLVGTGVVVAPRYRKTTSIVLGVIYVFLAGVSMLIPPQKVGWQLISVISYIVGIAIVIIGTTEEL